MDIRNFFGKKGSAKKPNIKQESSCPTTKSTKRAKGKVLPSKSLAVQRKKNDESSTINKKKTTDDCMRIDSDATTTDDEFVLAKDRKRSSCKPKVGQDQKPPKKKRYSNNTASLSQKQTKDADLEATTEEEEEEFHIPKGQKQPSRATTVGNKKKRIVMEDSDDDETGGSDNDDESDFKADDDNSDNDGSELKTSIRVARKQPSRKKILTNNDSKTANNDTTQNKKRKIATTVTKTTNLETSKGESNGNNGINKRKEHNIKLEDLNSSLSSYPAESVKVSNCLEGICFVFSGVLPDVSREDAEDYIKILGGRVTKAVSGKTNYLVCGETLEDGRNYKEGSKYRKAKELGDSKVKIILGKGLFFSLVRCIDQQKFSSKNQIQKENRTNVTPTKVVNNPYSKKTKTHKPQKSPISNPYASKSPVNNPYAKSPKSNPYKNKKSTNNNTKQICGGGRASMSDSNALWTDKYAPSSTHQILGNQESVRKLSAWLERWEDIFNNPHRKKRSPGAPGGPFKAALLSGPPGIGKTTTATLVAKQTGRTVLELNASDTRSKKSLVAGLGDVTGSQVLSFTKPSMKTNHNKKNVQTKQKRCIIMDEVDGMGAGDRSGMSEVIKMIKESKVPIICICNDRQSQKIRSLVPYCLDLKYRRPVKTVIARRAVEIGAMEGLIVEPNAAEAIAESCGNDIRQVVNCLQMWASKKKKEKNSGSANNDMTYKALKERHDFINKDEILRISMFDATKLIVEGPKGTASTDPKAATDSLFKRCDAFFTDYNLMGLNVHQNYVKVMVSQFQEKKRENDEDAELQCLERMHTATSAMSDFAVAENSVRGGDQNWSLLPLCSVLAVKAGYHIAGPTGSFLPGYPQFAGWLGKNSSRGKMMRLLTELNHHMNYQVSSDTTELRLLYLPVLRQFFMNLMVREEGPRTDEVINMMDEYGLDRHDLFENIDQFTLESNPKRFSDIESKVKAAFTREYNKRAHKSQALVEEQGISRTRKKKFNSASESTESGDLDVVNDDAEINNDNESEDEELDVKALNELFKSKGRGSKAKPITKNSKGKKKK